MQRRARDLTEEQRAAMQARHARFRELVRRVAGMAEGEREEFAAQLPGVATVEGRLLSQANTILCAMQRREGLSLVGGFRQWKRAGRAVRKGERGLMIWIPKTQKENSEGAEEVERQGFFMGTVFDITQTEEVAGQ